MTKYAIGIDIGGTNTRVGVVTQDGKCIDKKLIRTDDYNDVNLFVNDVSDLISILKDNLPDDSEIIGIGIGAPNGNFYKGTIEFAPNLKWKGIIPLADMLNKKTNLSTYLTNDANAAAIGEMQFGGAKNMKNFIFITLGTGLGSGFVAGGELIYGSTGFAGELGHTIIYQGGRKCGCGRLGCLETYCSATGIARTVQKKLFIDKRHSILRNINIDLIDSKSIYEAALFNDEIALEAFEYTGKILGLILANAVAVTSPEAIFLFGGLALAGDLIFKPTEYWMNYYMLNIFKNTVKLLPSQLPDNDAAILGAAAMVWKNEQK